MKFTVKLEIECGETTCASEPGMFCKYVGAVKFGTVPVCMLFPFDRGGHYTFLREVTDEPRKGWLKRCTACMEASR